MTCYLCNQTIAAQQEVENHHPIYKSRGGTETAPTHKECHRAHHQDDFREWGKIGGQISALDKHWAFTLRGVKDNPLYEQARQFNRAMYAHQPTGAGLTVCPSSLMRRL